MDFIQLRSNLQNPYSNAVWHDILRFIFSEQISFDSKLENILIEKGKAKSVQRFASIVLQDNINIAVLEIETTKDIQIARNRVALREIVFKLIDQDRYHGLLVLYYSEDKKQQDYRLSFISSQTEFDSDGNLIKSQTNPKRFSYVLGADESCTTAAQRFLHLKAKVPRHQPFGDNKIISLKDLLDAFSVEALNKEFFKKYKEIHYKNFWEYIANTPQYAKLLIDKEPTELIQRQKPIRDFVKKLLGRIVFLHFLQKKGWMGCNADSIEWSNGDKQFLQNLFTNYPDKPHFYSTCLIELFHNTLNNADRKNGLFKYTKTRVPYLNGGLFDDDQPQTNHIDFPETYFTDLFDFFSQYNFTIDENSPDEQEVGIDPEMLGHIFENLLEDNKDKGTFYTPRQIVHYMCQESLIEYLKTYLPNANKDALEDFIRNGNIGDRKDKKNFIITHAKRIEELLDGVKICDPAIGSGAFPMGMLQEIFKAKLSLDLTLDRALLKKEIIQNSIYGVDIEKGAVDIARLRFWLALVVDEDEPQPLPNLDYKIMQGNSLLESFEGVDLSKLIGDEAEDDVVIASKGQMELQGFGKEQTVFVFDKTTKQEIQNLINLYFDFDTATSKKYKTKQAVKQAINKVVDGKLSAKFALDKISLQNKLIEKQQHQKANAINAKDPKGIALRKEKAAQRLNKEIEVLEYKISHFKDVLNKLTQWEHEDNNRTYFLWHTYFKDVFDEGGFDIVIGNPPYVQLQNEGGKLAKQYQNSGFKTFAPTGDIYSLFYEKGWQMLKPHGVLSFITSNKWMRAGYGESTRKFFAENTNPVLLIDFAGQKIFESATVDTNILVFTRDKNRQQTQACIVKEKVLNNLSVFVRQHGGLSEFNNENSWVIHSGIEKRIKEKIERVGTPLKDWDIQINYGIKTGLNDAFIITGEKRKELINQDSKSEEIIRPILRGRDIKRYSHEFADLWLLYIPWHFPLHMDNSITGASEIAEKAFKIQYPAIYNHLLCYKEELSNRNQAETGIRYEWYALQRWGANYMDDFSKQKILWAETMRIHKNNSLKFPRFGIDEKGEFLTDKTCFFATGEKIDFVLGVLNSSMGRYLCSQYVSILDDGGYLMQKLYLEKIPLPPYRKDIELLVKAIRENENSYDLEYRLDQKVFELYLLNSEEIDFIEFQYDQSHFVSYRTV